MLEHGDFTSHSGLLLPWKINLDDWTPADWDCCAKIIAITNKIKFSEVVGIPRGGLKFAEACRPYITPGDYPWLLVDDVLTAGASMEEWYSYGPTIAPSIAGKVGIGVVVYCRGPKPAWVRTIFTVSDWAQGTQTDWASS